MSWHGETECIFIVSVATSVLPAYEPVSICSCFGWAAMAAVRRPGHPFFNGETRVEVETQNLTPSYRGPPLRPTSRYPSALSSDGPRGDVRSAHLLLANNLVSVTRGLGPIHVPPLKALIAEDVKIVKKQQRIIFIIIEDVLVPALSHLEVFFFRKDPHQRDGQRLKVIGLKREGGVFGARVKALGQLLLFFWRKTTPPNRDFGVLLIKEVLYKTSALLVTIRAELLTSEIL